MNYLKSGLKVFKDYLLSLILFVVFLYPFIVITGNRFLDWLPIYSILVFLLMFSITYSDLKSIAKREKRPQYNLNPYPLKGLVIGIIGFLPFIVLELIYPFIVFDNTTANRIKELALKTLLGPVFFSIRFTGGNTISYVIASLIVPVIAMLGYMAGYYDFYLSSPLRKNDSKK